MQWNNPLGLSIECKGFCVACILVVLLDFKTNENFVKSLSRTNMVIIKINLNLETKQLGRNIILVIKGISL